MPELYPEVIRGLWFCLKAETDFVAAWSKRSYDVYLFLISGDFVRMTLKDGNKRELETGKYTFDGQFLITRGRSTETYRVTIDQMDAWQLQGKKHDLHLVRTLTDRQTLEEYIARDLRILPIRAQAEIIHKNLPQCYWLTYERDDTQSTLLAILTVDELEGEHGWVGVTPLVDGLEPKTWSRLVTESFLADELVDHQWSGVTVAFVEEDDALDASI